MIEFKCGQCGAGMEAPQSQAGGVESCPQCGSPNRVPKPARPAAVAPESLARMSRALKPADARPGNGLKAERPRIGKPLLIVGVIAAVIAAAGVGGYLAVRQMHPNGTNGAPARPAAAVQVPASNTPGSAVANLSAKPPKEPVARQDALPVQVHPAPPEPLSVVHGGAWVTRKNGSSDLLRGLEVSLLNNTLVDPAIIRVEYQKGIGRLTEEHDSQMKEFKNAKDQNDKEQSRLADYGIKPYRGLEEHYKDCAGRLADRIASIRADEGKITSSEDLQSAYKRFAFANDYWGTTYFYACAATAVRQEVHADSEGKFTFTGVPPGRYYVYALMNNSTSFIEWLVPINVAGGKEVRCDLYNENAATIYNKN